MADVRIADILQSEYSEFLEFCLIADKKNRSELAGADYVAFRSQYGIPRDKIAQLRRLIESYEAPPAPELVPEDDNATPKVLDIDDAKDCAVDNNTSAMETNHDQMANDSGCEHEIPLYQLFSVDCESYSHMPLLESDMGVRVCNCLRTGIKKDGTTASCETIGDLLRLSLFQLSNYKNMGKLSIERIMSTLRTILCVESDQNETARSLPVSADCKRQVLAMLHNESYDISGFDDAENAAFSKYIAAYEMIGEEVALATVNGSRAVADIIQMLQCFYQKIHCLHELKARFDNAAFAIPLAIEKLPVEPFITAYNMSAVSNNLPCPISIDPEATVLDFVDAIRHHGADAETVYQYAIPFVKWLKFDVTALCKPLRDCLEKQRDNAQFIFAQRMSGETLEAVGSIMGVTRERVRQIEKKVSIKIASSYKAQKRDRDILAAIYALRSGDTILRFDEIAATVGDADAQIIWYLAKKDLINGELYHFSHHSNAVVFGDEIQQVAFSTLLASLPAVIEKSQMPQYLAELVEQHGVSEKLLHIQLRSVYKLNGLFYHRGRITVVFMCDYILRTRFPNGYKVADKSDQQRLLSYMDEVFELKNRMSPRAVDAKISEVGVLIDRGKYMHPSYIDVEKAIIDEINAYIGNSSRVVFTYIELFDTFSDRLKGTSINNRYFLQGVLKWYGCPFVLRKDYVTKEPGINLASEFEHFVKQSGCVHKRVLLEEFNGLSDISLGFYCQQLTTIVGLGGGYYIHASQLHINEEDYDEQRKFLLMACSDTPVTIRILYHEYMMQFTDFMIRNNIESQGNLFGILRHMFGDAFYFSRPYISLNQDTNLTNRSVLLQHLADVNSIEIEDLIDICEKNGIHFISTRTLIATVEPEFIRIGKTLLMKKELVGVDDDCVLDTAERIEEIVRTHGGYCASKNIDDFSWFPELNVPWNTYLLESVSALAGDLLTVLRINTSTIYAPVNIYIGDAFVDEDINSLTVRLLIEESRIEPFASKEALLDWLQAAGLCNAVFPSFLETEGHLHYDETGRVRVL